MDCKAEIRQPGYFLYRHCACCGRNFFLGRHGLVVVDCQSCAAKTERLFPDFLHCCECLGEHETRQTAHALGRDIKRPPGIIGGARKLARLVVLHLEGLDSGDRGKSLRTIYGRLLSDIFDVLVPIKRRDTGGCTVHQSRHLTISKQIPVKGKAQ